jgi:mannose-6-phosphate isomerase
LTPPRISGQLCAHTKEEPLTSTASSGAGRADVRVVPKPWGHEIIWAHSDRYVGKLLFIKAGHALSVQYHNRKDETIHLLSGEMAYRVQVDGELRDVQLRAGESYRNTPGVVHQMEAITDCQVLEASTPDLDDVVRLSDRYGRAGTSAP